MMSHIELNTMVEEMVSLGLGPDDISYFITASIQDDIDFNMHVATEMLLAESLANEGMMAARRACRAGDRPALLRAKKKLHASGVLFRRVADVISSPMGGLI